MDIQYNKIQSWDQLLSANFLINLYLSPYGRISRQNYILASIFLVSMVTLSLFPLAFLGLFLQAMEFPLFSDLVFFIPMFMGAYGFVTLTCKRLHDLNLSGWWGMAGLIPLFGTLPMFIILFLIRGTEGDNRYGRDII